MKIFSIILIFLFSCGFDPATFEVEKPPEFPSFYWSCVNKDGEETKGKAIVRTFTIKNEDKYVKCIVEFKE